MGYQRVSRRVQYGWCSRSQEALNQLWASISMHTYGLVNMHILYTYAHMQTRMHTHRSSSIEVYLWYCLQARIRLSTVQVPICPHLRT